MRNVKYGFGLYDAVDVSYFIKPHRVQRDGSLFINLKMNTKIRTLALTLRPLFRCNSFATKCDYVTATSICNNDVLGFESNYFR